MSKFMKAFDDFSKCNKVIDSCKTIGHLATALSMIHNYGCTYGFDSRWSVLDTRASKLFKENMDRLDYEERLEEIK